MSNLVGCRIFDCLKCSLVIYSFAACFGCGSEQDRSQNLKLVGEWRFAHGVSGANVSPDGRYVAIGYAGVTLIDVHARKVLWEQPSERATGAAWFSRDSKYLLLNSVSTQRVKRILVANPQDVVEVKVPSVLWQFTPGNSDNTCYGLDGDRVVWAIDFDSRTATAVLDTKVILTDPLLIPEEPYLMRIATTKDDRIVVCRAGKLLCASPRDSADRWVKQLVGMSVQGITVRDDDTILAECVSADQLFLVKLDAKTGAELHRTAFSSSHAICSLVDETYIAVDEPAIGFPTNISIQRFGEPRGPIVEATPTDCQFGVPSSDLGVVAAIEQRRKAVRIFRTKPQ